MRTIHLLPIFVAAADVCAVIARTYNRMAEITCRITLRKMAATMSGLICIGLSFNCAHAQPQRTLESSFENGPEGWYIYDYNGGIASGGNSFYPVTWEKTGGVTNSGHIWADDSRWRIDTPESPQIIFPFILYRNLKLILPELKILYRDWGNGDVPFKVTTFGRGELDLRNAKVSVYLRGDGLDLKGAKCFFWAFNGTRWVYTGHPLQIQQGSWGPKQTFTLTNEESLWQRTWSATPTSPANLDQALKGSFCHGFCFLGFSNEVTGTISMDQLEITLSVRK